MRRTSTIALFMLIALASTPLDAQRRRRGGEPIPSWSIEPIVRASILKDDAVMFAGGRIGRQMDSTLNLGVAGAMLITESAETQRENGFDRITSLVYLGPSIELRDSLRGPARFIVRTAGVVGLLGFEEALGETHASGTTIIGGAELDVGVVVRINRFMQVSATAGMMYGWRFDGGPAVVSGPSAAFGVRLVR